jgi:DNA methyltransferase 1-associated protein 1
LLPGYPYAKYNVPSNVHAYDDDEYTRFLGGSYTFFVPQVSHVTFFVADDEWTKEETDYLFNLVREYDSRWYIIYDRYEFPNGTPRTMEASHHHFILFIC